MQLTIKIILLFIFISNCVLAQNDLSTYKKLDKSLKLIETQYVDNINSSELVTAAVKAMISELDPHSIYLSANQLEANNEQLNSEFGGVGIQYLILNDTFIVLNVVKGGPSESVGITAGDKLIEVDGKSVVNENANNEYFSNLLRDETGTTIKLKVIKHIDKSIKEYVIKRGEIPIKTIPASYLIAKNTGYIKITNFSRSTSKEFELALLQLELLGMHNLILDLRDNPGGLMTAAINVVDEFLPEKKIILYTKGAHTQKIEYDSKPNGLLETGKIIVLINENSASSAEITTGVVQDWDRGVIMGRRSYGKGLVGRNFDLPDGSSIRLITGRYYTPSGRCIQKDYTLGESSKYKDNLAERYNNGELYHSDSIHLPDSLKYYTADKRLVYGGGGIMPDYFVPLDTSYYSNYLSELNKYGVINYYVGLYFDKNIENIKKEFPNYKLFIKNFKITDSDFDEFKKIAENEYEIKPNDKDILNSKTYICNITKALLARYIYEDDVFYEIINKEDKMVIKAVQLIQNNKEFSKYI